MENNPPNDNTSFPKGILSAVFLDPEATAIKITSSTDGKQAQTDVCQVDPESPMFQDLMKLTTLETIEEDSIENTKLEIANWKRFDEWEKHEGEIEKWKKGEWKRTEAFVKKNKEEAEAFVNKHEEEWAKAKTSEQRAALAEPTIAQLDAHWSLKKLIKNVTEDFTKEDLFTLKLDVFATDVVTNSEDRVKRSAIRKANTPLEILVCYNAML